MGYRHERDKFGISELTAIASDLVAPPRVAECPVQLEAVVDDWHVVGDSKPETRGLLPAIEVRIVRVHIEEGLLMEGQADRIDPDRWRPLIMSFSQFYGLGPRVHPSRLAEIPESLYRPPSSMAAPTHQGASR
jgi:flavin reductase (DIM6/NTAB) family NADH-FMN oxidoreductase RutF